MRLFINLLALILMSFQAIGKEVISPSKLDYPLLSHPVKLTNIDTNFFITSIVLQNKTDVNQTFTIQSRQSGTHKITVCTMYEEFTLFSPLQNTFAYFFSNILSHTVEIPPNESKTIKYEVQSLDPQPVLFVKSELNAQLVNVKTIVVLGVFYGIATTIVLYITFLYFSTFKQEFIWFISYILIAIVFLSNRINFLWPYLPNFITKFPLMFDDLLVILSIGAFVLLTISITKPNRKWRSVLYGIMLLKTIFHVIAWINYEDPVYVFSLSRKFSGLSTLVFIPLFYIHFKTQKKIFLIFFCSMLGIAGTNIYFDIIDYQSVFEEPITYLTLITPFTIHILLLTGAFLIELQKLAEDKFALEQRINKIKRENHASFIKGTQIEQKKLAEKIDLSLLQPIQRLQLSSFVINPQIAKEIENVSQDLKRIINGITPKNIGIENELEKIIQSVNSPEKYTLSVFHSEAKLSDELQSVLIRITQEAINNIEKHAFASKVNIDFFKSNNTYFLSVYDNGVGFDPYQKNTGIGLKNMDKYIEELNGKLSISSAINQGSTLLFSFKQEFSA